MVEKYSQEIEYAEGERALYVKCLEGVFKIGNFVSGVPGYRIEDGVFQVDVNEAFADFVPRRSLPTDLYWKVSDAEFVRDEERLFISGHLDNFPYGAFKMYNDEAVYTVYSYPLGVDEDRTFEPDELDNKMRVERDSKHVTFADRDEIESIFSNSGCPIVELTASDERNY